MNCGKNRSWLMMIGCLLPVIVLVGAIAFGVKSPYLNALAFLACPLMMVIMMMNQKKGERCH